MEISTQTAEDIHLSIDHRPLAGALNQATILLVLVLFKSGPDQLIKTLTQRESPLVLVYRQHTAVGWNKRWRIDV